MKLYLKNRRPVKIDQKTAKRITSMINENKAEIPMLVEVFSESKEIFFAVRLSEVVMIR